MEIKQRRTSIGKHMIRRLIIEYLMEADIMDKESTKCFARQYSRTWFIPNTRIKIP